MRKNRKICSAFSFFQLEAPAIGFEILLLNGVHLPSLLSRPVQSHSWDRLQLGKGGPVPPLGRQILFLRMSLLSGVPTPRGLDVPHKIHMPPLLSLIMAKQTHKTGRANNMGGLLFSRLSSQEVIYAILYCAKFGDQTDT